MYREYYGIDSRSTFTNCIAKTTTSTTFTSEALKTFANVQRQLLITQTMIQRYHVADYIEPSEEAVVTATGRWLCWKNSEDTARRTEQYSIRGNGNTRSSTWHHWTGTQLPKLKRLKKKVSKDIMTLITHDETESNGTSWTTQEGPN